MLSLEWTLSGTDPFTYGCALGLVLYSMDDNTVGIRAKEDGESEDEENDDYDYGNTIKHSGMMIREDQWRAKGHHASYPALMFYSRVLKCLQSRRVGQGCSPLKRSPSCYPRENLGRTANTSLGGPKSFRGSSNVC